MVSKNLKDIIRKLLPFNLAIKKMKNSSSPLETSPSTSTKKRKISSLAKDVRESSPQPYHPHSDLEAGDVFVVGSGDCGQLGLGQDVLEKERPALLEFFRYKEIIQVKAGGLHNLALSKSGLVYSWGCNDQCALGRGGEETEPGLVSGLPSSVISLACGDSCSVALTSDGTVFCWGTFRDNNGIFGLFCDSSVQSVPRLVKELRNIIFIDAGANHIVAVSREGKVYTWGVGEQGQLGRKVMSRHVKESSLIPRPINFRPYKLSNKFKKAFAGGYHTFLLHETGYLFSCGLNNYGQLGTGDTNSVEIPEQVSLIENVVSVGGGEHHSVALDALGKTIPT